MNDSSALAKAVAKTVVRRRWRWRAKAIVVANAMAAAKAMAVAKAIAVAKAMAMAKAVAKTVVRRPLRLR
jgi:hypothetical protein